VQIINMAALGSSEILDIAAAHGITGGKELVSFVLGYTQGASNNKSKLENCTLSYFPLPGRGEPTRLALIIGGITFKEDNFGFPEFGKRKAAGDFVFGTVPELTLKDGTKICQTRSIQRLVAKHTGLYPKDSVAAAHVDAVMDICEDFISFIINSAKGIDLKTESEKFIAARLECATTGKLGQGLANLEKFLLKTGTEGFAVGDKATIADVVLFGGLTFLGSGFFDGIPADYTNKFPRITSIRKKMANHKAIAAYYDSKKTKNKFDDLYIAARDL